MSDVQCLNCRMWPFCLTRNFVFCIFSLPKASSCHLQEPTHYIRVWLRPVPPPEARDIVDMNDIQSPRRYSVPPIGFDILNLFRHRLGENSKLHAKYINPAGVKSMPLIGS